MKTAIKILVIIAAVIGIIWSVVGFFGVWFGGSVIAAGQASFGNDTKAAEGTVNATSTTMLKLIGAFVVIIIGLIFGIIAAGEKAKKVTTIINGTLLLICGVLATIWASYVAGPIYILSGFLAVIKGATIKQLEEKTAANNL